MYTQRILMIVHFLLFFWSSWIIALSFVERITVNLSFKKYIYINRRKCFSSLLSWSNCIWLWCFGLLSKLIVQSLRSSRRETIFIFNEISISSTNRLSINLFFFSSYFLFVLHRFVIFVFYGVLRWQRTINCLSSLVLLSRTLQSAFGLAFFVRALLQHMCLRCTRMHLFIAQKEFSWLLRLFYSLSSSAFEVAMKTKLVFVPFSHTCVCCIYLLNV